MKIYIASSWKNEHAVVMLTFYLRAEGYEVLSFVENNYGEGHGSVKPMNFEEWVLTDKAENSFRYDTDGASKSDLVVYLSPSGPDAWAEVGIAYASNVPIVGLWAKGEQIGLMRKLVTKWLPSVKDLLGLLRDMQAEMDKTAEASE